MRTEYVLRYQTDSDVMNSCSALNVMHLVGKKWTLPLLETVELHGSRGFNTLQVRMKTISPKVLSGRLKELESERLVRKRSRSDSSGRYHTAYALTKQGKELMVIVNALKRWNERSNTRMHGCSSRACVNCPLYG